MPPKTEDGLRPARASSFIAWTKILMAHGKKWGLYKAGGRSQPVECTFCGRLVPRIKAVPLRRKFGIDNIPGVDPKQVYIPERKGYACISCAKHRKLI